MTRQRGQIESESYSLTVSAMDALSNSPFPVDRFRELHHFSRHYKTAPPGFAAHLRNAHAHETAQGENVATRRRISKVVSLMLEDLEASVDDIIEEVWIEEPLAVTTGDVNDRGSYPPTRTGLYVAVALTDSDRPLPVDRRAGVAVVTRENTKVGKSHHLENARRRRYEGLFAPASVAWAERAGIPLARLKEVEDETLLRIKALSSVTTVGRTREWFTGLTMRRALELVDEVLRDLGLPVYSGPDGDPELDHEGNPPR